MMTHEEFDALAALDALGASSPEDATALRDHLAECADCRRAHDDYAEAATLLARDLDPVAPPAGTRERIVGAVTAVDGEADVIEAQRRLGISPWWLATAATLFLALWGWRELSIRVAREHITSQEAEIRRLSVENERLAAHEHKLSSELAALSGPQTRTIALAGMQMAPSASARVFLEPQKRRAVIFFYNMPGNPADKSYQLWIIRGDQPKPQGAGVFDVTTNGAASISVENLPVDTEIKALAVTLEPRGGVEQPTNSNYYVMGHT